MDRRGIRGENTVVDGWKHSCRWIFKAKTNRTFRENCIGEHRGTKKIASSRRP